MLKKKMDMELIENIYPVFGQLINRVNKEKLLNQKAKALWLTGLSGSGKTTIGVSLEKELYNMGYLTQVLDGDNIRSGINKNLKFSDQDRMENIRRIAEVTKLFLNCGVITINCFITPTEEIRQIARDIIEKENMIEVFINAPIEICEARDPKGLYKKARNGELKNFTGIDSVFEYPKNADIEIQTDTLNVEQATQKLLLYVLDKIRRKVDN
jgi:adenylylsulfate kinase